MDNKNKLSPWEMANNFVEIWDGNKLAWIVLTIVLVLVIHAVSTRIVKKKSASWKGFLFWMISIVGWTFIMYMVMWDMMKARSSESSTLIIISSLVTLVGFIFFFKVIKDPEKKEWVSRIVTGLVLSIMIFGIFIFMGNDEQELALAGFMGGLLGAFISLAWFNLYNMINSAGDGNRTNSRDEISDDDWQAPDI